MKTPWTNERLQRLFNRYSRHFWNRRLRPCAVRVANLRKEKALGLFRRDERLILIDVSMHHSDRDIRATLLHEMAHAATRSRVAHNEAFWAQLEKLFRLGACVSVDVPEGALVLLQQTDLVPRKFPLCRRAAQRVFYRRRRRKVTDAEVVGSFECSALMEVPWRGARWAVGRDLGLIDADGRPVDKEAARLLRKGYRAHRRAWRNTVEERELGHILGLSPGWWGPGAFSETI